jgi:NAD(P)-dependent dehydrogenase (short-subunit alcohol dehydrogenase family)
MLRARSSGVARNSLHMQGQAADLRLDSRSVNDIARAAAACQAGGVGRYSGSGFVHMDCGRRAQLGRLRPPSPRLGGDRRGGPFRFGTEPIGPPPVVSRHPSVPQETAMPDTLAPQDPRGQYPQPPFPEQPQPVPGLAREMDPRPDHGEESYRGSGRLQGRRALVTGGDSGIGRAAAIAFAREGADVAISYLGAEEPDAKEVLALIAAEGRTAVPLPGDLTDEATARQVVEDAVTALGGLDVLVINAGHQQTVESVMDITTAELDETLKTNVYAMFWMAQAAIPHLKPGASIILTASVQAYEPSSTLIHYAVTKAANVAFAKALASELIEKGIRVNAVAPGPFWTALQSSGGQTPEKVKVFGQDTPFGRPGQPVEIAPVYVHLASQESSYTTGEVYGVTGGKGIA